MAELASGAVSSLLGLLRSEAVLLGGVGIDVQFIKEEMESMHSFLEYLAETEPPGGGHNKQVRTWMRQVRDLAQDCRSCIINVFLQRENRAVYRVRGGRWRYLWWATWFLHKLIDQHKAAVRLRVLKERARDVAKRRSRYGVEIPGKAAVAGASASAAAMSTRLADTEEEDDHRDVQMQGAVVADSSNDPRRRALFEPCTVEEYCTNRLVDWLKHVMKSKTKEGSVMPSVAIVTPDKKVAKNVVNDTVNTVKVQAKHMVFVDLPKVHLYFLLLRPFDILYYILWVLEKQQPEQAKGEQQDNDDKQEEGEDEKEEEQEEEEKEEEEEEEEGEEDGEEEEEEGQEGEDEDEEEEEDEEDIGSDFWDAYKRKLEVHEEIVKKIEKMKVDTKIKKIKTKIIQIKREIMEGEKITGDTSFIGTTTSILSMALLLLNSPTLEKKDLGMARNEAARMLKWDKRKFIRRMARKLQCNIEEDSNQIRLDLAQYEGILQEMMIYPNSKSKKEQQSEKQEQDNQGFTDIPVEKQDVEITSGQHQNNQEATYVPVKKQDQEQITRVIKETMKKVNKMKRKIEEKLLLKGTVGKIKGRLQDKRGLIMINDSINYISRWEEIGNALSLLVDCVAGAVILTTTKDGERAKKFCCETGEPITYSPVGRYHDIVLQSIGQRVNKDARYNPLVLKILEKCDPHEFCMKMFAHALYSNPNRSTEELHILCEDLQVSNNSWATNAKKMFKFSYNDLPREHKSCLLYLAIFPPGYKIQRSTIIGRWITEGLITKEDWITAVHHADRCFDNLINRWLVLPHDIGTAGKVKSCVVADEVHEYISKIAYKGQILDARLSKRWARHFSIFSDLQLRDSDSIKKFVQKLPQYSPQLPLLKVLDLEGCQWLEKDHRYLKDICSKILLLKYLSLRRTNIPHLPSEINNLLELEVLDIRQTKVRQHETRDVLLLKLKRLLAGHDDPSTTSVQIPRKIKKMENMEVLSNVKASRHDGEDIKDIRNLWQLRKLGLVINDTKAHLENFLRVASDLKEYLKSVSITITETRREGTLQQDTRTIKRLKQPPKHLESLIIRGTTEKVPLLQFLASGSNELAKVTLSSTKLKQENLQDLAELPKLRCVRLRHRAYTEEEFTFQKNEFKHLKCFIVEGPNMTGIIFGNEAAPELEKITLSSTNIKSLRGVGSLPKLIELKLEDNKDLLSLFEDEAATEPNTKTRLFTFKNKEFQHLKNFFVQGPSMTDIIFEEGTLLELEKIVLCNTNVKNISGADKLPKLKELELTSMHLFSFFENAKQMTKVTLRDTLLNQSDLQILATKPSMTCLELLDKSYKESELNFNENGFKNLNTVIVKCSEITKVSFSDRSAPNLKKFIWFYTKIESLSGIWNLRKLKELEFCGDPVPYQVRKEIESHKNKPSLTQKKLEQQDQEKERRLEDDDDDDARCSPISWILKKGQH